MKRIYLDYAASTPIDKKILSFAKKGFDEFGNPSSIHYFGQKSLAILDQSRQKIADFFLCQPREVIFTGSATESNNLAIRGVIDFFISQKEKTPHIISSEIEHKSVLKTIKDLEKKGVEVSLIKPNKFGKIEAKNVLSAIKENTILISVMVANNETGVIQPIKEISRGLEKIKNQWGERPIFHTDATQYIHYLKGGIDDLGVDLISFSGHKIFAPKGIGGLIVKNSVNILPIITGGDQEYKLRAGTENVFGAMCLAKAVDLIGENQEKSIDKIDKLSKYFLGELKKISPNLILNSGNEKIVPHILNIQFPKSKFDELLILFDLKGLAVSAGSACSSRSITPSYVLSAQGLSGEQVRGSIRFSFGKFNTMGEIKKAISILKKFI